jgi:hypothetical protein
MKIREQVYSECGFVDIFFFKITICNKKQSFGQTKLRLQQIKSTDRCLTVQTYTVQIWKPRAGIQNAEACRSSSDLLIINLYRKEK